MNVSWFLSRHTPKPPPSTPAGAVVTLGLATLGGTLAGGISEWRSQSEQAAHPAPPDESPMSVAPHRKGIGRAIALLPMAFWTQTIVCLPLAGRRLPRWTGLTGSAVAALGWTGRRLVTPPEPQDRPIPDRYPAVPIRYHGEIRSCAHQPKPAGA